MSSHAFYGTYVKKLMWQAVSVGGLQPQTAVGIGKNILGTKGYKTFRDVPEKEVPGMTRSIEEALNAARREKGR